MSVYLTGVALPVAMDDQLKGEKDKDDISRPELSQEARVTGKYWALPQ